MLQRNTIQLAGIISYLFFQLFSHGSLASSLSDIEQKIKNTVIENQSDAISFLEKIVNINSGTENISGVKEVGEIFRNELDQLGFKTYWVEFPPELNRAGTLFARREGSSGKKLLLIGHLDTVFPQQSSFQKFTTIDKKYVKGPGVSDCKGGDVVMLYALKALANNHALDDTTITVALMGDEEHTARPFEISRKELINLAKQSDIALDFESSVDVDVANIARRGSGMWIITAEGKEAHSAQIFSKSVGAGAIFELTRILNTMRRKLSHEKYLSFNVGMIVGGTNVSVDQNKYQANTFGKHNIVAQKAVAYGDIRYLLPNQLQITQNKIKEIVAQHLPNTQATVSFTEGVPAMSPTRQNKKLLLQYSDVSVDLGYDKVNAADPVLRGAGDISHIAEYVTAGLVGLGVVGKGEHSENEMMDVTSLPIMTSRAAILIYRLTHTK